MAPTLSDSRAPAHPPQLIGALLALTFTTGLVDAVSLLGLGRVFTANMTGNVVLLGFGFDPDVQSPPTPRLLAAGP